MLSIYKIQLKFSASLPCCVPPTVHFPLPTFYLGTKLHLREGRVGTSWELSGQPASYFPPHLCNNKCTASYFIQLLSSVFNFYGLYYNAAVSKCTPQVSIFFPVLYTPTFHYQFSYLRHFPTLHFASSLPLSGRRAGIAWETSKQYIFCRPLVKINLVPVTVPPPPTLPPHLAVSL